MDGASSRARSSDRLAAGAGPGSVARQELGPAASWLEPALTVGVDGGAPAECQLSGAAVAAPLMPAPVTRSRCWFGFMLSPRRALVVGAAALALLALSGAEQEPGRRKISGSTRSLGLALANAQSGARRAQSRGRGRWHSIPALSTPASTASPPTRTAETTLGDASLRLARGQQRALGRELRSRMHAELVEQRGRELGYRARRAVAGPRDVALR